MPPTSNNTIIIAKALNNTYILTALYLIFMGICIYNILSFDKFIPVYIFLVLTFMCGKPVLQSWYQRVNSIITDT